MINYCLWLCVITLVQLSLIYLWFDSQLFHPLFQWCLKQRTDKGWRWYVFTLLTCSTCLGMWFAGICTALCYFIPGCPACNQSWYELLITFGVTTLAVSVLSRIIDGFMPEPISQKLFVVEPEDEKTDSTEE